MVLCDVQKPPALWIAPTAYERNVDSREHGHVAQTPTTPVSAGAVTALQKLIQEDACSLDETKKHRLQKHLQKLGNAARLSFAERALLREHNQFLVNVNNEAKVRRSTKSEILGTARVMSYEDLVRARADRARRERAKEAKKASKEGKRKRDARGFEEPGYHANPHGALSGVTSRVRKRKSDAGSTHPPDAACAGQAAHREQEIAWTCPGQGTWHTILPILSPQRAPMAPM
jgi:hypothetical protein